MNTSEDDLSNSCPSSEWQNLRQYAALAYHGIADKYMETYRGSLGPSIIDLSGKTSQRQQYHAYNSGLDPRIAPAGSTTQMVAVADALTTVGTLWLLSLNNVTTKSGRGSPLSHQSNAIHSLTGESLQGFNLGVCVPDVISGDADEHPLAFPLLYDANNPKQSNTRLAFMDGSTVPAILHTSVSRKDILASPGDPYQYRLQWVELPQPSFNGSSIGAVVLSPLVGDTTQPQRIFVCNFAAGWGTTSLQVHTTHTGSDSTVSSKVARHPNQKNSIFPIASEEPVTENENDVFQYDPDYPQRPIYITSAWARHLNPTVQSTNRSVFDLMMQERLTIQGPESVEAIAVSTTDILAEMISNGLARVGFESTLQGDPKMLPSSDGGSWIDGNYWLSGKGDVFEEPEQNSDWIKLHIQSRLQGYAYNTAITPPRLAIAVLTTYCIIALAHVIYSGVTGKLLELPFLIALIHDSFA